MKKNKKIAVLGCGYWGTIVVNTLISMKLFDKIYIYDPDLNKVNILINKFKKKIQYSNYKSIVNNIEIKDIFLATPPKNNFNLLKELIVAKKNILVEKPGLISLKDFKIIKNLLKTNNVKLLFGYVYIYNQYIKFIKKLIKSKKLGAIRYINFQRQNFGPIRSNVSSIYDLATHDLSILHFFFDKASVLKNKIKHDILKKKNFDISFLNLEIDKTKVDINVSWLNPEKIRKIIIIGSKKMLVFDEMNNRKPIQIYDNYVSFPKIDKFSKNFFNQSKYIYKGKSRSVRFKEKKSLNEEIKHFLKSNMIITDIDFSEKIIKTISKL